MQPPVTSVSIRSAFPAPTGQAPNYVGQPIFAFTGFSTLGNASGANPFLFRDNQFTGDVNLSWTKRKHATKYGFTYYHFRPQPLSAIRRFRR